MPGSLLQCGNGKAVPGCLALCAGMKNAAIVIFPAIFFNYGQTGENGFCQIICAGGVAYPIANNP